MATETLDTVEQAVRVIWAHRTPLQAAMAMILRDPHLVEDAFSDATLAMIKAWPSYDQRRPFLPWGLAIARCTALQKVQSQSRLLVSDAAVELLSEEVASSGDEPYREACFVALEHCVDRLPPRHRKLVHSRYYKRHAYEQIAARLGKTVGALHCIFHRVYQRLSKCVLRELRDQ